MTLALSLNLGAPVPQEAESVTSGRHLQADAPWLEILRDTSIPIDVRLDLVTTEQSFGEWMLQLVEQAPRMDAFDLSLIAALPDGDPISSKLSAGIRAMIAGFDAMSDEGRKLMSDEAPKALFQQQTDGARHRGNIISQMMTDPRIPDIIGDEIASFMGGFAAGVAAEALQDDPELAQTLAGEFAARMQRVPRLLVLSLVSGGRESCLREGWQSHVSPGDLEILARDVKASNSYVYDLQRLSGSESVA